MSTSVALMGPAAITGFGTPVGRQIRSVRQGLLLVRLDEWMGVVLGSREVEWMASKQWSYVTFAHIGDNIPIHYIHNPLNAFYCSPPLYMAISNLKTAVVGEPPFYMPRHG